MSLSSSDEQRWNELQLVAQDLEAQDVELARRASGLSGALREGNAAASALRALEAAESASGSQGGGSGEADSLVPLGLGLYGRARISYGTGVIVSIGAGAAVEKDTGAALNHVDARIKEIEVEVQDVNAMRAEVAQHAGRVRQELDAIMRRAAGEAGADVAAAAGRPAEGRA